MTIRLLALDLDGTLLDRQSRLPEENREAVARAGAAGLDVVLVTGRSWRGTQEYYKQLGLTGPAILYLGALVVADGTGQIIRHRPLVPEAWRLLRQMALTEGLPLTACSGADLAVAEGELPPAGHMVADTAVATGKADDFLDWEGWNPYTEIVPDLYTVTAPPTMVAIYGDRAARRVLAAFPHGLPESQFDLTDRIAGETVLHVWHSTVDKGWALADFCRNRGYRPEEVAAVGDAIMDITMIQFAGVGVAVPDAHPLLKAAAQWVASPAEAIDRILRGV